MPRLARFTIDNGIYHVMVRGNERRNIFHDEEDFQYYKEVLKDNKEKYGYKLYHYVLMDNHIHIMMQVPLGSDLSRAMKTINLGYSQYYRKKYGGVGHFFSRQIQKFCNSERQVYA